MNVDLTAVGAVLFVATPLVLLIVRIFVIPDGASLEDLIAPRLDLDWPQGVQEEEPVPWQTEMLTPQDRRASAPTPRHVARDVSRVPGP